MIDSVAVEHSEEEFDGVSWRAAHGALTRLARQRCAADAEEGRWLLRAFRAAAHVYLGFGSFGEYIERLFGYQPRSTREKLRVAEALEQLPVLRQALEQGELTWSAARELTRVAVAETEQQWLELGRSKTVRQLEELVAGKHLGDDPDAPPDPSMRRRVLRFEVKPETFAAFREAMAELRRRSGAPVDDDSALLEMARQVLAGPRDAGRSSYQMVLSVCSVCAAGRQLGSGELVPVAPEIVSMAWCDAQHVGHAGETHDPAAKNAPDQQASSTTDDPAQRTVAANENGRTEREVTAPDAAHVGTTTGKRARQSIPPRLRRSVLLRDQHRCRVPGCQHTAFVDLHHIEPRSEGGEHSLENLVTVCGSHHRALHRGELIVEGAASSPVFRHSDGRKYGQRPDPSVVEVQTKLFQALRGLGFREGEVRAVLADVLGDVALRDAPLQRVLREALVRIRVRQSGPGG